MLQEANDNLNTAKADLQQKLRITEELQGEVIRLREGNDNMFRENADLKRQFQESRDTNERHIAERKDVQRLIDNLRKAIDELQTDDNSLQARASKAENVNKRMRSLLEVE